MDGEDRYGTSRDTAPFASSPAYPLHRLVADEPDVGDAPALGPGEHIGHGLVLVPLVWPDVKPALPGGVGRRPQPPFECLAARDRQPDPHQRRSNSHTQLTPRRL